MNKLKVTFIPELESLDITSVEELLEVRTPREFIAHVNWGEYPYRPIAAFNIARTERDLYIRYNVMGNSLKASYGEDDSDVHKDSCVEFFMKKEDEPYYMNFEFNCIGTCDAARRTSREVKTSLSAEEYASILRYPSLERKTFGEVEGFHAWSLTVVIPLRLMGLDPEHLPEKIRGNFYKCADDTANPHFLSWSPIDLPEPNFHCPDFFGEIWFR